MRRCEVWNDVRKKIERNAPDITKLGLGAAYPVPVPFPPSGVLYQGLRFFLPGIDEWERVGHHIGQNTNLKELVVDYPALIPAFAHAYNNSFDTKKHINEYMEKLFRGVASNRSIQSLQINFSMIGFSGKTFVDLIPFFKSNTNFVCLHIDGDMASEDLSILTSALRAFDGLKDFSLDFPARDGPQDLPASVIQALIGHPCLTKIDLRRCMTDRNGCVALAALLQKPDATLRALKLECFHIDDGDGELEHLAINIAGCSTLKELELDVSISGISGANLGPRFRETLFSALQNSACSLGVLSLANIAPDDAIMSLSSALTSHKDLKILNLRNVCQIVGGVTPLLEFLRNNPVNMLEELDLSGNQFNVENINTLTNSLGNNRTLRKLGLAGILSAGDGPQVWRAISTGFSAIFQNQNSALEHLILFGNFFCIGATDETILAFATALENNSTLKELVLGDYFILDSINDRESNITSDGWDALSRVLCDTSSIMGTYHSNHTLQNIDFNREGRELPNLTEDLRTMLNINKNCNSKIEAARLKIIRTHFSEGFNTYPFVGMPLKVLPHTIAWMGRGGRCNAVDGRLYEFVGISMVGRGLFLLNDENRKRRRGYFFHEDTNGVNISEPAEPASEISPWSEHFRICR
ncbi:hypothetical protein ACHAWF_015547 [Thalassiosira exigua]